MLLILGLANLCSIGSLTARLLMFVHSKVRAAYRAVFVNNKNIARLRKLIAISAK